MMEIPHLRDRTCPLSTATATATSQWISHCLTKYGQSGRRKLHQLNRVECDELPVCSVCVTIPSSVRVGITHVPHPGMKMDVDIMGFVKGHMSWSVPTPSASIGLCI